MAQAQRGSTGGEISTLLGKGSEFEGKLTFEGAVQIDGVFKGEVFSDDVLIVGEGARIEAEINVGEIVIHGIVIGNVKAKRSIEVFSAGKVRGDLTTPSLQIQKGAIFEGRSCMEDLQKGPTKTPPGPAPSAKAPTDITSGKK